MSDEEEKTTSKRAASPVGSGDEGSKKRKIIHKSKPTVADSDDEGAGPEEGDGAVEVLKNDDGDAYIEMSKLRRLTVREFKGATLIDIREYYEDKKTGKSLPGKKGISLSVDQWKLLKEAMPTIDEMVEGKSRSGASKKSK